MKRVSAYKTFDGQFFEEQAEAYNHEQQLRIAEPIEKWVDQTFRYSIPSEHRKIISDCMIKYFDELQLIFNEQAEK